MVMLGSSCSPCCADACICTLFQAHTLELRTWRTNFNPLSPSQNAMNKIIGTYILQLETPSSVQIPNAHGGCANYLYAGPAAGDSSVTNFELRNYYNTAQATVNISSNTITLTDGAASYQIRLFDILTPWPNNGLYCNPGQGNPVVLVKDDLGFGLSVFAPGNVFVGTLGYAVS